jgi:hypothetical protein
MDIHIDKLNRLPSPEIDALYMMDLFLKMYQINWGKICFNKSCWNKWISIWNKSELHLYTIYTYQKQNQRQIIDLNIITKL